MKIISFLIAKQIPETNDFEIKDQHGDIDITLTEDSNQHLPVMVDNYLKQHNIPLIGYNAINNGTGWAEYIFAVGN